STRQIDQRATHTRWLDARDPRQVGDEARAAPFQEIEHLRLIGAKLAGLLMLLGLRQGLSGKEGDTQLVARSRLGPPEPGPPAEPPSPPRAPARAARSARLESPDGGGSHPPGRSGHESPGTAR